VLARSTARDLAPLLDVIKPDIVVYEQMDFGAAMPHPRDVLEHLVDHFG
jgi:hypothetical protein